jgi:hypothetical protein
MNNEGIALRSERANFIKGRSNKEVDWQLEKENEA